MRRRSLSITFNHMVNHSPLILNHVFAALADPTRRSILEQLSRGDRCVSDLAEPHAMSLPAVSKHLRVLEEAGLVSREKQGRVHTIKLNASPMRQAQAWMEAYRRFWEDSFDRLDEHLKTLQQTQSKKNQPSS